MEPFPPWSWLKGVGLTSRDLLSELRGLRDAVKDIARSMEERQRAYYLLQEAVETVHPIRKMLEEDASPKVDLGDRLIRLGVIMIALPLPIISEVPGALLLAGGLALKKIGSRKAHLTDVYQELHRIREELMIIKGKANL